MNNFEVIYNLYANRVFKFLLKLTRDYYLAEELTQETFVRAFINLDKFQGKSKLSVWLCQISKNLYFDHMNQLNKLSYIKNVPIYKQSTLEENLLKKDDLNNSLKLIMQLPDPHRTIFLDKIYLELSYKEISNEYGKSESWARVTFYRAKCMLQKKMKEKNL